MYYNNDWALVVPLANEAAEFDFFVAELSGVLDHLQSGKVYLVVDRASKDNTLEKCRQLSASDQRYVTVWAPENKNVVDAYIRGYNEACKNNHEFIIEMDAGLSHDPKAIPMFLRVLNEGNDCAFGSRFINGGSMWDSSLKRKMLSKTGTLLSNVLLNTRLRDMTSGFQGFRKHVVEDFLKYPLLSKAHFYQTELRYLLRKRKMIEVPIHYKAPSPRVSQGAILNSLKVLFVYFLLRISFKSRSI